MGFAAFSLTRTKGGVETGKITIIFPKVEKPLYKGDDYKPLTVADLVAIPDFPIEMHLITANPARAKELGFGNIIDFNLYAGEIWEMPNGAKIAFQDGTIPNLPISAPSIAFFKPNAFPLYFSAISQNSTTLAILPCLVSEKQNDKNVAGNASYFRTDVYGKPDKFEYPQGEYFPWSVKESYYSFFDGAVPVVVTDDPYDPGGETEPGGGTGSFDGTGDDISIPGVPTLSAVDAGFITLFNPSLSEMNALASYMWSDLFDVDGWKKIFADPMGAILGLSIVPVAVPSGGTRAVSVGNISTGVNMTVAASQYVVVDCGTLNVNEFWGAYLDYDPYTKAEIYLPYIGTHALATDDIMNKPVHVVYHVDILSGACCAYIQCGGTVLYSFVGQCASSIPITGDNWTNVINGALSIAGSIGSMVATGGASAPMAIGNIASTAVNSMKPTVEKSGSMGGTGGMLGVQTPYLILTRPRQAVPKRQNEFTGYPSFITELLGDLTGYTEIEHIHLENVPATEPELSEIESLLKSGVIF